MSQEINSALGYKKGTMYEEIRESITLTNEGQKIFAIFHRPKTSNSVPAVLICPGFAGNKCGRYRLFVRLSQQLAQAGIASLRFDYRGAGDSEGDFSEITLSGNVSDALLGLKWLSTNSHVDPYKIGLFGRSLGGVISVLAANQFNKIKSLVLWAAVYDSSQWKSLWDSYQSNQLTDMQKQVIQRLPAGIPNLQFLNEFFKIEMDQEFEKLRHIPLLHIESKKDSVVHANQGQCYRKARKDVDNTKFIQLLNSDHDFSDSTDQEMAIKETIHWFKETL